MCGHLFVEDPLAFSPILFFRLRQVLKVLISWISWEVKSICRPSLYKHPSVANNPTAYANSLRHSVDTLD
jgi:hypothetical protein